MTPTPKWGDGPGIPIPEGERAFYRGIYRVMLIGAIGMFIVGVVSGTPWHTMAGCMMLGLTMGKWAAPHIRRLDTDRYPAGQDFEMATPSLSATYALSQMGVSVP